APSEALLRRASLEHGQATLMASGSTGGTLARWLNVPLSPIGGRVSRVRSPRGRRCQALRIDGCERVYPDPSGRDTTPHRRSNQSKTAFDSTEFPSRIDDRGAVAAELA